MASSVASAPAAGDWPRPSDRPAPQGENARWIEADRAERCKRRTESLHCRDVVLRDGFVLHVDPRARFFVVNKPAGMYVEDVLEFIERYMEEVRRAPERDSERSKRAKTGSDVATSIREAFNSLAKVGKRFQLLHRLDRDTTGCLGIACDKETNRILSRAFQEGRVKKHYVAHCINTEFADDFEKKWKDWEVDEPFEDGGGATTWPRRFCNFRLECHTGHGRSKHGLWRLYAKEDVGRELPGGSKVKEARTNLYHGFDSSSDGKRLAHLRRLRSFPVVAEPITGRTHQIRMHCSQYFPIVGDYKYGYDDEAQDGVVEDEREKGYRLHSFSLELPIPDGNGSSPTQVLAPPPSWWNEEEWGTYDILIQRFFA